LIVVSGVLVLVALIFLIIGLLGDGLAMIWLSIGTSVVAGVFLLLGALQRRGAPAPAAESMPSGPDMLERVTAVSVRPRETEAEAAAETAETPAASAGDVAVVPGRPRYHVTGCRFLAGRPDVESMAVEQAREEGYTACGVCKPDAALAAAAPEPEPATEEPAEPEAAEEPVAEEAPAPAKKAPAKRTRTAAASGAARGATATVEAPAKPAKKTAAKAASSAGTSQVVVIPDRGKFHAETCRFVKDVPGTVTLSKASAKRQGYAPCGVCKP
jgi:hypothetical protein